ncbi:selenium cofactor biosynthesis protein YqeC [Adlercreutzia sp. ZJ138]|uniref:selenium cofactor biosynthesis protein YqeC n=1 Tax=Adlercreutzia sp. ZJ138 TaxID=2709405 RepID=UPI0013ECE5B0|nr:selenium cofactor biosynthesis protein YqeC [Adlercreutzia sp. ZJ138]
MTKIEQQKPLFQEIGLTQGDVVAITGAGGKTSLMLHLCNELRMASKRVLATTTTKMYYPNEFPGRVVVDDDISRLADIFATEDVKSLYVASAFAKENKVCGYGAAAVDNVASRLTDAVLLIEADGAACKPYKFYREDEPVLPRTTTHVVHVVGSEILNQPMSAELFHRCPQDHMGKLFTLDEFEQSIECFSWTKLKGFQGRVSLIINKADEGRKQAARSMKEVAAPYFDACFVVSLKELSWEH